MLYMRGFETCWLRTHLLGSDDDAAGDEIAVPTGILLIKGATCALVLS
jgi:hypothetical protein